MGIFGPGARSAVPRSIIIDPSNVTNASPCRKGAFLHPFEVPVATIPEALNLALLAEKTGDHGRAEFIYRQILQALPDEPNALRAAA